MIKKTFLELIQKRLKVIDETNQYGLQYLEGIVDMYWEKFAYNYFATAEGDFDFYTKTETLNMVAISNRLHTHTITPTSKYIRFPSTMRSSGSDGVFNITSNVDSTWKCVPIRRNEFQRIQNLPVFTTATETYFWVGYDTIYIGGTVPAPVVSGALSVTLLIPFSGFTMTENIPLPTDMDQLLADSVIAFVMGTPPPDLINNNSDA